MELLSCNNKRVSLYEGMEVGSNKSFRAKLAAGEKHIRGLAA